jgi:S-adenosyl methyltransferase
MWITTRLSWPMPGRCLRAALAWPSWPGTCASPARSLASPALRGIINLSQPVCVILAAVLHFISPYEADAVMPMITGALAPGSYLILSAGTSTGTDPALIDRLAAAYAETTVVTGRTEAEIAAYFAGLDLEPPGLTDVWSWRPDSPRRRLPAGARILGAVARKPASGSANQFRRARRDHD